MSPSTGEPARDRQRHEHRVAILTPLAAKPRCTRIAAQTAAAALGISPRRVFDLVRRLREAQGNPAILRSPRSAGGRGRSRLTPEVDRAIRNLIEEMRQAGIVKVSAGAIAQLRSRCREQELPMPSISTLRRRLRTFVPEQQIVPASLRLRQPRVKEIDANLLAMLYETVGNHAGWSPFLTELTKASPFQRATLVCYDTLTKDGGFGAHANLEPAEVDAYAQHYASVDPWLAQPEKRPVGLVVTSDAIVSHSNFLKTEFYQDYCRPVDIDLAIGLTVRRDGARSMAVGLFGRQRNLGQANDLVARLQSLAPHLLRVAQLDRQLAMLDARATVAETALDGLDNAMLVVDAGRKVLYLNATAKLMIADADGLAVRRMSLVVDRPTEDESLQHLVHSALQARDVLAGTAGGVMRISRRSTRAAYEVLVTPLAGTMKGLGFDGPLAAVFVRDPDRQPVVQAERLRRLYALSGAEARLMSALLAGDTMSSIAERFRLSRETLRSQLKGIFGKTGTGSQIELIRLGLRGIAAMRR